MPTGSGPISPTPQNNLNGTDRKTSADNNASSSSGHSNGSSKLPTVSYDHTSYVQRARATRPAPPKPCANPMQFVQIKPCNLYQSAQEQLKRAEEVKKVKEIKKEEPEDWQNNLDNWKSSRRKRVEHIIDRVVEVKKLELEEHDRTRRKSKTFSEMMEEKKCSRRVTKLAAIVYAEDESNDLSDLGIGTSSASGKSSLSEDCDNQSVMSDNVDNDKHSIDLDHQSNHDGENGGTSRGYTSSPGYDTSSSTAPASSPDPCEYTYEGAIQDYKTRISKAQSSTYNNGFRNNLTVTGNYSKDSTPERIISQTETTTTFHNTRRPSGTKIENRLMSFEIKSASDLQSDSSLGGTKKDLPKVDILKRRELFEKENSATNNTVAALNKQGGSSNDFSNSKSIKERLSHLEKNKSSATPAQTADETKKTPSNRLSGDISSIKDRLQILEKQPTAADKAPKIDVPVVSLKDRLSSLQSAVTKEETKKPVVLIDEYQLEMMKQEDMMRQQQQRQLLELKDDASHTDEENIHSSQEILSIQDESNVDTDREDSGIHTTDVSCSVSQTDEQPELLLNEETHHHHHINANDCLYDEHQENDHTIDQPAVSAEADEVSTSEPPTSKLDETCQLEAPVEDRSLSITTPEPVNDLDASVSLSLSESPTTSSHTVIFDGGCDLVHQDEDQRLTTHTVAGTSVDSYNIVYTSSQNRDSSKSMVREYNASLMPNPSLSSNDSDKQTNETEFTNVGHTNTEQHPSENTNTDNKVEITPIQPIGHNISKSDSPLSPKDRRKTVVEVCEKRNLKSVEDANNFPTPFVNVNFEDIGEESPVTKRKLEPVNIVQEVQEVDQSYDKQRQSPVAKRSLEKVDEEIQQTKVDNFEIGVESKTNEAFLISKPGDQLPTVLDVIPKRNISSNQNQISETQVERNAPQNIVECKPERDCSQNETAMVIQTDVVTEEKGIVVAELEVVTTEIKVRPQSPTNSSGLTSPTSPPINPKTHPLALKPKNIFDFIKKNFNSNTENAEPVKEASTTINRRDTIAIDNSKFYVPVEVMEPTTSISTVPTAPPTIVPSPSGSGKNEVNIQITKTTKTEKIVEKTDSLDSTNTMTSEINQLLDEELSKLTIEDTRL